MSIERLELVPEGTRVTFELSNKLPVLREVYESPGLGTVVLKGLLNPSAHLTMAAGTRYRTLRVRKNELVPNELIYPVVRLPDKQEAFVLHTPIRFQQGSTPRLRFWTTVNEEQYTFRQVAPGRRGYELWDAMEMTKLVNREAEVKLMPDLTVLYPVPAPLLLLFPWLDSQPLPSRQR